MSDLIQWAARWGNVASVLGVLLTFIGFGLTIAGIRKSRSAAVAAQIAAEETRRLLLRDSVLGTLTSAVANLEEIRRLHRAAAWSMLPDRYAALRERLVVVRMIGRDWTHEEVAILRGAETEISEIEKKVDRALAKGTQPPNPAKFNEILSLSQNRLQEILMRLKQTSEVLQ